MKRFGKGLIVVTLLAITACMLVACGETDYTEIAHNSDYYISLSEDERSDFDVKLEKIISGAIFENMSEEEKLELVNALVESEKLQKEIAAEEEQWTINFNNVKKELSEFSDELKILFYSDENFIDYFNKLIDYYVNCYQDSYYTILYYTSLKADFNTMIDSMAEFDINVVSQKLNEYISELRFVENDLIYAINDTYDERVGISYTIELIECALGKIDADAGYYLYSDVYNAIKDVKDAFRAIIDSTTSSADKIVKAKENLDKFEKIEQEYAYYEIVYTVKNILETNTTFIATYGATLRKIDGIYKYMGRAYLSGSFIQEREISGVSIFSQTDNFFDIFELISGDETYLEILDILSLSNDPMIVIDKICVNFNSKENEEYFEQNKYEIDDWFAKLESRGYELTVEKSWNIDGEKSWNIEGRDEYPEFIIKATSADDEQYLMVEYVESIGEYASPAIKKICPEFWAQMEIENNKQSS